MEQFSYDSLEKLSLPQIFELPEAALYQIIEDGPLSTIQKLNIDPTEPLLAVSILKNELDASTARARVATTMPDVSALGTIARMSVSERTDMALQKPSHLNTLLEQIESASEDLYKLRFSVQAPREMAHVATAWKAQCLETQFGEALDEIKALKEQLASHNREYMRQKRMHFPDDHDEDPSIKRTELDRAQGRMVCELTEWLNSKKTKGNIKRKRRL